MTGTIDDELVAESPYYPSFTCDRASDTWLDNMNLVFFDDKPKKLIGKTIDICVRFLDGTGATIEADTVVTIVDD